MAAQQIDNQLTVESQVFLVKQPRTPQPTPVELPLMLVQSTSLSMPNTAGPA